MAAAKPVNVSPLIKAARWTFLSLGVVYGATRLATLNRAEKIRKAEWERTRPEREAKAAAEKLRKTLEEEKELARQTGVEISA